MPSKSKKQHKFMAAVANNPGFADKVGVPPSVGASFMKKDKKVKKYQAGGVAGMNEMAMDAAALRRSSAPPGMADALEPGEGTRGLNPEEFPSRVMQEEQREYLRKLEEAQNPKKAKKKKKPQKKMGGGMLKYAYGGKVKGVRGAGCARQGVRKAKMITMRGA